MSDSKKIDHQLSQEEISLVELYKLIWIKKYFIILVTFSFILISIFYAFSKTTIFEVKAIIEVGSILKNREKANINEIENVNALINKINIIYNINVNKKIKTRLRSIALLPKTERLLEINVQSTSNKEGLVLLNKIITGITDSHQEIIGNYRGLISERLKFFEVERTKLLEREQLIIQKILKKEQNIERILIQNAAVAAIYSLNLNSQSMELAAIRKRVHEINKEIADINLDLLPVNIKQTNILGDIILNTHPIEPKKTLIVILGTLLGFVFSIIYILVLRSIKRLKATL